MLCARFDPRLNLLDMVFRRTLWQCWQATYNAGFAGKRRKNGRL